MKQPMILIWPICLRLTIDLNTFLDICPNSVSGLVPSAILDPVPYPYPVPEVPYPIPYVGPNAALGPKEKQPKK